MKLHHCLCVIVVLAVVACSIESGTPPRRTFDQLMMQAREALAQGDGLAAHNLLADALELKPHESSASLALALADVLQLVHFGDEIVTFVGNLSTQVSEKYLNDPGGLNPNGNLNDTIHHFVKHIFEPVLDEMLVALGDARSDPLVSLQLTALPIVFQNKTLIDLGGTWDANDAYWLEGTVRLVQGAVDLLQGTNLDLDVGFVLGAPVVQKLLAKEPIDWATAGQDLAAALLQVFEDPAHQDFLLPLPDEMWRFQRAQRNLALGVIYWVGIWRRIDAEPTNPPDDVLGFVDGNQNGRRDPNEPYEWLGRYPFTPLEMKLMPLLLTIGANLGGALAERTDLDETDAVIETLDLSLFNMFLELLGLPDLIPHTYYNLADLFADPPAAQIKEFLTETLDCASHESGLIGVVLCVVNSVNP